MKIKGKQLLGLFKTASVDWMNDHAPRLGAALAFYTIFSLAPLLTIAISIASLWFTENAGSQIFSELGTIIGADNAKSLQEMVVQPGKEKQGLFAAISSAVMLAIGATGVFVQLQDSLNAVWEVKPKPGQGIMGFVRNRLLSFAMVLGIAFLLLTSLLLTAAIAAVGKYFSHLFGDATVLFQVLNTLASFALITLLFALMFKYVPDVRLAWKDVWFGAIITSVLFAIGKFALGMYLGKSSVVSSYSVAGALIVTLLWVYYTAQIVFFGAELTQAYVHASGREIAPSGHAEKDHAKQIQRESAEKDRERNKAAKQPSRPLAAPSFAARAASAHGKNGKLSKRLGGAVLLALILLPIEKKWFRHVKA